MVWPSGAPVNGRFEQAMSERSPDLHWDTMTGRARAVAALSVVVLAACGAGCGGPAAPRAVGGVLDLREWRLERDGPVSLDGEWEFYWGRLLDPGDFGHADPPAPQALARVPGPWSRVRVDGRSLPSLGFGTYRLRVRLHEAGQPLAVSVASMSTSYRLWADERLVAANGRVGGDSASAAPQFRPTIGSFVPRTPEVALVVQVANFSFREGGMRNRIEVGTDTQISSRDGARLAIGSVLLGSILVMGLYHLGLYWLRPADRPALWFGAFCLTIAVKFFVEGNLLLTRLWPAFPWELQLRIEYLANAGTVPFFYLFLAALYPADVPRVAVRLAQAVGGLLALAVVATPVRISSWLTPPYEVVAAAFVIYAALVFVRAARRGRTDGWLLAAGGTVFLATVFHDLLSYGQIIHTPRLLPLGLFVLILTQTGVLAHRFAEAFRRQAVLADENARLLGDLRAHVDELGRSRRLLAEREEALRRQIAEMLHGRVQTRLLVAWQWLRQALALVRSDLPRAEALVVSASDEIHRVQQEDVRQASHLLHPSIVDIGLVPAVRSLAARFGDQVRIVTEVDPRVARIDDDLDGGIPPVVRLAAYRVIEEALGNVLAHAGAQNVRLSLALEAAGHLAIRVQDDGRGFDPARPTSGGLGLRSVAGRVADLGGTWRLDNLPRGAVLSATLPLDPAVAEPSDQRARRSRK